MLRTIGIKPAVGFGVDIRLIGASGYTPPASDTKHVRLPRNYISNINVGKAEEDLVLLVNYTARRGTQHQMGSIFILNKGATAEHLFEFFGEDIGLYFSAQINSGNIILIATVDNSTEQNIVMDYVIEVVKYV